MNDGEWEMHDGECMMRMDGEGEKDWNGLFCGGDVM